MNSNLFFNVQNRLISKESQNQDTQTRGLKETDSIFLKKKSLTGANQEAGSSHREAKIADPRDKSQEFETLKSFKAGKHNMPLRPRTQKMNYAEDQTTDEVVEKSYLERYFQETEANFGENDSLVSSDISFPSKQISEEEEEKKEDDFDIEKNQQGFRTSAMQHKQDLSVTKTKFRADMHKKSKFVAYLMDEFLEDSSHPDYVHCQECYSEEGTKVEFLYTNALKHLAQLHKDKFRRYEKEFLKAIDFFNMVQQDEAKIKTIIRKFEISYDKFKEVVDIYFSKDEKNKDIVFGEMYYHLKQIVKSEGLKPNIKKETKKMISEFKKHHEFLNKKQSLENSYKRPPNHDLLDLDPKHKKVKGF